MDRDSPTFWIILVDSGLLFGLMLVWFVAWMSLFVFRQLSRRSRYGNFFRYTPVLYFVASILVFMIRENSIDLAAIKQGGMSATIVSEQAYILEYSSVIIFVLSAVLFVALKFAHRPTANSVESGRSRD